MRETLREKERQRIEGYMCNSSSGCSSSSSSSIIVILLTVFALLLFCIFCIFYIYKRTSSSVLTGLDIV